MANGVVFAEIEENYGNGSGGADDIIIDLNGTDGPNVKYADIYSVSINFSFGGSLWGASKGRISCSDSGHWSKNACNKFLK